MTTVGDVLGTVDPESTWSEVSRQGSRNRPISSTDLQRLAGRPAVGEWSAIDEYDQFSDALQADHDRTQAALAILRRQRAARMERTLRAAAERRQKLDRFLADARDRGCGHALCKHCGSCPVCPPLPARSEVAA